MKKLILIGAIAATLSPILVHAESTVVIGGTPNNTAANLDFRIIIPKVLFFAVGTGSAGAGIAANGTIDTVTFDYTNNPADVGTLNVAGNVVTNAAVPVRIRGNGGVIGLTATTIGALTNASSDTIPWTEIVGVSSDATNFPTPVIPASGIGASSAVVVSSGTKVTNRSATWTYSYANSAVVAAGTYGAINGLVTYTATMP